jgi:hypothetical protein
MDRRASCVLGLALLAGTACSPQAGQGLETAPPATQVLPTEATEAASVTPAAAMTDTAAPAGTATPPSSTGTPASDLDQSLLGLPQVEHAKRDLAQRFGIAPVDIEVLSVEAVTWPDSSLGCPQPDMGYAQVLVEGLLIRLGHARQTYNYHSGGSQPPFLCIQAAPDVKGTPLFGDITVMPPKPGS